MLSRTEKWREKREEIKNQNKMLIKILDCPLIRYDDIFEDEFNNEVHKLIKSILNDEE